MADTKVKQPTARRSVVPKQDGKEGAAAPQEEVKVETPVVQDEVVDTPPTEEEKADPEIKADEETPASSDEHSEELTPESEEKAVEEVADSKTPNEVALRGAMEVTPDDLELLYVMVPKPFQLRLTHNLVIQIKAGAQRLEKVLVEHWYSAAHNVEKIK